MCFEMKTSFRREHVFPSVVATQCMSILKWVFAQSCVCTRLYVLFWKCRKLQLMHNHSVNSENITMNCECPCKPISISMTKTNPHDDLKRAPKKRREYIFVLCLTHARHFCRTILRQRQRGPFIFHPCVSCCANTPNIFNGLSLTLMCRLKNPQRQSCSRMSFVVVLIVALNGNCLTIGFLT